MFKSDTRSNKSRDVFFAFAIMVGTGANLANGRTISPLIPVADTAMHEFAQSSACDGTNYLIAIKGSSSDANEACAQMMLTDGIQLGSLIQTGRPVQVSDNDNISAPCVAFGSGKYLMVWADAGSGHSSTGADVYGQFISTSGALLGSAFPISSNNGDEFVFDVASDGTDFCVVFASSGNLRGRFVSSDGTLGTEILVASDDTIASVGFGGGQYLVAWMEGSDGNHVPRGRLVSPSGVLGSSLELGSASVYFNDLSISYGSDRFLVVWSKNLSESAPWNLKGRLVLPNGALVGSGEMALVSSVSNDIVFGRCLASDGSYFLLVWTEIDFGAGNDISYGQYIDNDGNMLGVPFIIDSSPDAGSALDFVTGVSAVQGKALTLITTDAFGTGGNVYAVMIDSQPWSKLQHLPSGDMQLEFNGILESTTNLVSGSWAEVAPQPTNPWSFSPVEKETFFRASRLEEWEILFDGTSTDAFRGYRQTDFPNTNYWVVTTSGELMSVSNIAPVELITCSQYGSYELRWEWKASVMGNSGIHYRATETYTHSGSAGPEYQLIDDSGYSLPAIKSFGAAYRLFTPSNKTIAPVGQWNECRLILQGDHVQHWLNGDLILEYDINSTAWTNAIASASVYQKVDGYGQGTSPGNGHIILRNDTAPVWYRNIKIRPLPIE